MGRVKTIVLSKKTSPSRGICLLIENGVLCSRPVDQRGVCARHAAYLRAHTMLDQYALPAMSGVAKRYQLAPNPSAQKGICAVIENGVACAAVAQQRGLCRRHYNGIWQRPDLNLDDFARDGLAIQYSRAKTVSSGCVVREQIGKVFTVCGNPVHARGLCAKHYERLRGTPELFRRIANPLQNPSTFTLKRNPADGLCVIVENGEGCARPTTHRRRLCLDHLRALKRAGLLDELTGRFIDCPHVMERRAPDRIVPGFCILNVNGKPCNNPAKRRGLCETCFYQINKRGLKLDDYALPSKEVVKRNECTLVRKQTIVKAICNAVEDGEPCQAFPHARGLCALHYKLAQRRRQLDELALSVQELARLPELPLFYLDKNVVIRFAMWQHFGVKPESSSIELVESVQRYRAVATVSVDCVRAVYSHLGHRLARPTDVGGKGLSEHDAECEARRYTGELFFARGGLWRFVDFTPADLKSCTSMGQFPELSLEDALERRMYGREKCVCARMLFVTADTGVLNCTDAIHPTEAIKLLNGNVT